MKTNQLAAIAAAVLGIAGVVPTAEAIDVFSGGSSAGRQFINEVPLSVCDHTAAITHYQSANNNTHLWKCTFKKSDTTTVPVNFHYSARGSSDGVYPVDDITGGDRSKGKYNGKGFMGFIDVNNPSASGCGALGAVNKTFFDVDTNATVTVSIQENKTCTNPPSLIADDWVTPTFVRTSLDFGFSDVRFTSFGQSSPAGTEPADPAPNLATANNLMVLPFSLVIQNSVRRVDSANVDLGAVQSLTQTEVEQLFSRQVRDWRELGYAVATAVDPGVAPGATISSVATDHLVRLCMRDFGSGSKATMDQVLMKDESKETADVPADHLDGLGNPVLFYGPSSSDVKNCLNDTTGVGLKGKIGYIDSFEATASPTYISPATSGIAKSHVVNINGFRGVDTTVTDPNKATARPKVLQGLRCGKSEFWVNLEAYKKAAGTGNGDKDEFITRFLNDAKNTSVIQNLPANWAFEATPSILATKASDKAAPDHLPYASKATQYDNECRGFYASPAPF
jgi:hypothetical protein